MDIKYIILFIVSLIIIYLAYYFYNKKNNNTTTSSIIPLHIYQTWFTKNLPPKMKECVDKLKKSNPEFSHHLYDDEDCKTFIKENFDEDVLNAYCNLIPGAFKADLWRYCILYKRGGIYMDIKYSTAENVKLIDFTDKEYFILERPLSDENMLISDETKLINNKMIINMRTRNTNNKGVFSRNIYPIYNGILICKPGNTILLECINRIVQNVKNKNYGDDPLDITGPILLGKVYFNNNFIKNSNKLNDFELYYSITGQYILNKNGKVFEKYDTYDKERKVNAVENYSDMWKYRKVFKNNF